ncbi:hypothetical protein DFP72DRAFT_221356 [Ephemerocybe angulata]|uniref:G domain-containing protein n=1 Tax=Ephemerocybe angulata TaxID=980116 RepID=A0A8H6M7F7_9AGAR|nr:hypothetical protein DFP72DRAFT_221356 [Tulosesus angulatus]
MREHTIAVIGNDYTGKTTFIKAVHNAANARPGPSAAGEAPTHDQGIVEYTIPLPDGQVLTFLDTPAFHGYNVGLARTPENEEILEMLQEHLTANGARQVSHVLIFMNVSEMSSTEFNPRAQRIFEGLFLNAQVVCITTGWDQIEDGSSPPATAEEAERKEEVPGTMGMTSPVSALGCLPKPTYLLKTSYINSSPNRGRTVRSWRKGWQR